MIQFLLPWFVVPCTLQHHSEVTHCMTRSCSTSQSRTPRPLTVLIVHRSRLTSLYVCRHDCCGFDAQPQDCSSVLLLHVLPVPSVCWLCHHTAQHAWLVVSISIFFFSACFLQHALLRFSQHVLCIVVPWSHSCKRLSPFARLLIDAHSIGQLSANTSSAGFRSRFDDMQSRV